MIREEDMETATANLSIEIHVDCPNEECGAWIDLMNPNETSDYDHNDMGALLEQACPAEGHWSEEHEKFEVEEVICTECKTEFNVKGINW